MTAEEERRIIRRVLDGDNSAFEDLVLANQKNVYNLALKMIGNEEDALDVSQEAFLKAYSQLSGFRSESRFSVWLYRLTHNLCVDLIRKRRREKVVPLTYVDDEGTAAELELPDLRDLPEAAAIRHELRETIDEGIAALGERHREVFVMREVADLSYAEIAGTLGISEGTVKSRLSRARQNLVKNLADKGTFPAEYRHKDYRKDGMPDA